MVEGVVSGDSLEVLFKKITEQKIKKELRGDTSAAISMCTGDGTGSWRETPSCEGITFEVEG